jgi:LmbE family N-acetylglucosaminyl deacetylase
MLTLRLPHGAPLTVLCIGAHCDDIEIGAGATVAAWAAAYPESRFVWAVFAGDERRVRETRAVASALIGDASRIDFVQFAFRDSYFPAEFAAVKDAVARLRQEFNPTVVLTHYERDRHQDHRLLSELTGNAFRDHMVLEYEIPKYDGDLGQPNVYVPVTRELARRKIDLLLSGYPSQAGRDWFTDETFNSIMRLRGIECRASSGLAEAFFARKLVLAAS